MASRHREHVLGQELSTSRPGTQALLHQGTPLLAHTMCPRKRPKVGLDSPHYSPKSRGRFGALYKYLENILSSIFKYTPLIL